MLFCLHADDTFILQVVLLERESPCRSKGYKKSQFFLNSWHFICIQCSDFSQDSVQAGINLCTALIRSHHSISLLHLDSSFSAVLM